MTQRYEVKGKIGHGGLGEVYLAYDNQLDREVALKRVRPQEEGEAGADNLAADLIREAKTLSALQHPNIVTIYDVGRDEKGPFVIMEFLKGETLDKVIERGKLGAEDFKEVVLQIMEGMVAAGSLGLVHRDLKPGNVMVNWLASGRFQIKILDFGLAKFSRLAVPQTQDQEAGIFGSIFFMAPEQFERLPLDARTDMYSLGCIFYQVLTQKHPFDGHTPVDVMVSHLQHLVTPLHELRADLPRWMADWVMWLISREMDDRPADAQVALEFFHAQQSGLPSAAPVVHKVPAVKVVGRGSAPGVRTQTARPSGRTRAIKRTAHANAVSSRPAARKVRVRGNVTSVLIGLVVTAAIGGAGWYIYREASKPKENPRDVLAKLAGPAPAGDSSTVHALVKLAARGGADANDALAAMKKLKGAGVAPALATELEEAAGPLRGVLIEAVGAQPSSEGVAALTKIALAETGELRLKALEAIGSAGTPADVPGLMKHCAKFNDADSRKAFAKAVEKLLSTQDDRGKRARAIAPALKDADAASRPLILRLLGTCASSEANDALAAEFAATGERRRAAVDALKTWTAPDTALADAILAAAQSGDRDILTGAYCRTVTRVSALPAADIVARLRKALPVADSVRSREEFCAALATLGSREAFDFATELAASSDAVLAAAAKPALEKIKKQQEQTMTLQKGETTLDGSNAVIVGEGKDAYYSNTVRYITGWRSPQTKIAWDIVVPAAAVLEVEVVQSSVKDGHSMFLSLGPVTTETNVKVTKTTDDFVRVSAGKFSVSKLGSWRLWIEAGRMTENESLVNIRSVIVRMK